MHEPCISNVELRSTVPEPAASVQTGVWREEALQDGVDRPSRRPMLQAQPVSRRCVRTSISELFGRSKPLPFQARNGCDDGEGRNDRMVTLRKLFPLSSASRSFSFSLDMRRRTRGPIELRLAALMADARLHFLMESQNLPCALGATSTLRKQSRRVCSQSYKMADPKSMSFSTGWRSEAIINGA